MKSIASIILVVILVIPFSDIKAKRFAYNPVEKSSESPKRIVRDFLTWYKNNRGIFEKFQLVSGKPGDSTRAYRVDFKETEKYLMELKKSGFVSDQYIKSFRKYFETADAGLNRNPQYNGTAEGFGFDLVLKASDPNEILDHLKKMEFITKPVNSDSTKVYVRFPTVIMALTLSRSGNTWLIDSLDYV